MSRQWTEKGLRELGELLHSVHGVVNKTSGTEVWSFLFLTGGLVVIEFRRLWMAGTGELLIAEC